MFTGKHLLFEATLKEASQDVSPDTFAVPPGATPQPGQRRMSAPGLNLHRESSHRVLSRGMGSMRTLGDTGGRAQVKVWVDEGGKVTKAAVEDADNKNLAEAALAQARATVYQPYMENGRFVGFETVFEMNIAVGVGMGFPIGSPAMGGPTPNIGLGHP
jgi:hypothetical protein